jgi:hypothetical protein
MGWETRGTGRYYYHKRKVNGKAVSEYIGAGDGAVLMALMHQEEAHKRKAWQAVKHEQARLDKEIDELRDQVQTVVAALLLVAGYHQHKRMWRKQRAGD